MYPNFTAAAFKLNLFINNKGMKMIDKPVSGGGNAIRRE